VCEAPTNYVELSLASQGHSTGWASPSPDAHDYPRDAALRDQTSRQVETWYKALLTQLKAKLARSSRLVVVLYNPYLRGAYYLTNRLGIRKGELPSTFVTRVDLENIAKVAGFEIVRPRQAVDCPWKRKNLPLQFFWWCSRRLPR
jgi:hypothetical protein